MKKYQKLLIGIGISGLFFLSLVLYLSSVFQYDFFHREQQQLFLFDVDYVSDLLFQPGGIALFVARFFVQFFYSSLWSALLTALLLFLILFFLVGTIHRLGGKWSLYPLALYPIGALLLSLLDHCFFYEGVTSFLFLSAGFYLYLLLAERSIGWRTGSGLLLTLCLFVVAGAVASLFAACAWLCDCLMRRDKCYYSLLYLLVSMLLGVWAVQCGMVGQWVQSCTVANYYEWTLKMPVFHHLCWILFLLLPVFVYVFRTFSIEKRCFWQLILSFVLIGGAGIGYQKLFATQFNPLRATFYQYEYLTVTKQWKALQKVASRQLQHYNDANYLNLALAEQGILLDHLFTYSQFGPHSLVYIPNNKSADVRLAHLWLAMGNVAAAQNVSFNSLYGLSGYNPTMLQQLVQIELMRGNYTVARKYIELLEKSFHYADWATDHRAFLNQDGKVVQDPVLGNGRAAIPVNRSFVLLASPMDDLYQIVAANPAHPLAMQYAFAFLLLSKDFNNVQALVDTYYGTPALRRLPQPIQEALLFYSDYYHTLDESYAVEHGISSDQLASYQSVDLAYCQAHGVESATFDRFAQFKKGYEQVRQGAPLSVLDSFKHTFWYYLLFVQLG